MHKCLSAIAAFALTFIMIVSMLASSTAPVMAASKIKISAADKTLSIGETAKLKSNKSVKWSVANGKSFIKLSSIKSKSVTVKAVKTGTAIVNAKKGKTVKKIKINVLRKNAPSSIKLNLNHKSMDIGEFSIVSVESVKPAKASKAVKWSSSDRSVASVDNNGQVRGLSPGKVTITATSKVDKRAKASVDITVLDVKAGILSVKIDMTDESRYPAGKAVKAWFQVPVSDQNQNITNITHEAPAASREDITTDSTGGKAYYIEWGPDVKPADRKARLSFHVYRRQVVHGKDLKSEEKGTVDAVKYAEYLRQTQYSGSLTDGIVKETADKIVADAKAKTVYDKAHAIYLWICENITRDKSLANRELGDVVAVLSGQRDAGSCIDINSIFVALCNAEGIPARDSFGYKINSDPTKLGPNCRAEFYLPGHGWVEVDPAMPLGVIMYKEDQYRGENAPKADEWEVIKETYWTTGSASWICQNHGRDITFDPPQSASPDYMVNPDGTLNHFMFPYGEYDGKYIKGWGDFSKTFSYEYSFEEEDPTDCGC